MFGTYRYLLAALVVLHHTTPRLYGFEHGYGLYAVMCFYVLSGYLMTNVLCTRYGYTARGRMQFLANRALRIYPSYWVVLVLCLAVSASDALAPLRPPLMQWPHAASEWLRNVFIFGLTADEQVRLVPPAWSLHVELTFYVLMGIGLARWRNGVVLWAAASLALVVALFMNDASFSIRYSSIAGGTLPFALGSLIFHYRRAFAVLPTQRAFVLVGFLVWLLAAWRTIDAQREGIYLAVVVGSAMTITLKDLKPRRDDTLLGNLAYPVFLAHTPLIAILKWLGLPHSGLVLFLSALAATTSIAFALHLLVERPIAGLRAQLRRASPVAP